MPFKRSSKPVVFHRRWMIAKVFPDVGTELMPEYRLMDYFVLQWGANALHVQSWIRNT